MVSKPKFIETDFVLLNRMLGGGVPVGKIIEIFGFEGCGKTTLAMELSKVFKQVYYMDFEHELDTRYAKSIGAKFATFKQPVTFEDGIDDFFRSLKRDKERCDLLIIDTIGSAITNEQLEKELKDNTVGSLPGKVTIFLRKAEKILKPLGITLILLNHKKETIGAGFGDKYYTPGGRQIKYSASIRLSLTEKKNNVYEDDGIIVNIWTKKNKVAQEMIDKNCMYMIRRGLGMLRGEETFRI